MVIDAAKGIEARTRKLFEVCRLRDIPIVTFINKMDRETRDPFDLLDEIEKTLALDSAPLTWTIGRGRSLAGAYDIRRSRLTPLGKDAPRLPSTGPTIRALPSSCPSTSARKAIDELNLAVEGLKAFDKTGVPRRPYDPRPVGQRAQGFRRQGPHRRFGRIRAEPTRAGSSRAAR